MDTNLTAISNALFAPVVQEEAPAAEDSGIVDVDPDDYDTLGRETDEYDDEDSEYDEWIENTYYVGDGYDEYDEIKEALDRIDTALNYMDDEDHRYYGNEHNVLVSVIEKLTAVSKELESAAGDYSTF